MSNPIIEIELIANDKNLKGSFRDLKKTAEKEGSSIGSVFSNALQKSGINIGALAKGGLVVAAAAAAYKGLSTVLRTGFEEAQKTEDAINALNVALKNTGRFTPDISRDLVNYAEALSDVTTVGDDAIISTSALIQSLGNLDKQGLERATKAALNLSAALGVDLNSAAQLVGKAAAGEVGSLSRYGLIIEKGANQAETFEKVLSKLEDRFSGAAQAKASTFSGTIARLGIAFGDFSKAIAASITESEFFKGALDSITTSFKFWTNAIKPSTSSVAEQIASVTKELQDAKDKASQFEQALSSDKKKPAVTSFIENLFGTKEKRQQDLADLYADISSLSANLVELKKQQSADVGGGNVVGLSQTELDQIYENGKLIGLTQEQVLYENYAKEQDILTQLRENNLIGLEDYNNRVLFMEQKLQDDLNNIKTVESEKRLANQKKLDQLSATLGIQANQALTNGISMGVQSMVKSFILGEKSGQNFLGAMLGMLGDLSIQMGQTLVFAGLGIESLFALQGAGAIAAGAGLIALGTILKSFAGSNGGPSADAGGGGAGESLLSQGQSQLAQQQERVEPETRVVVNVQGSILDGDETGLRISNILKEASLNNNVKASVFA